MSPFLLQKESPVLEILDLLLGPALRRRLMVRQMFNDELFLKYQPELRLKIHNQLYLKTGMRRNELAGLKVRDVHSDFLMVIQGKVREERTG